MPRNGCARLFCHGGLILLFAANAGAGDPTERETRFPDNYILDFPSADQCCPPIRSTFFEADRTMSVVRGRRFRHKSNGGYGLPVVDKVDGKNLLHVGADLGWHQVGEPVFALANGVVRISTGPDTKAPRDKASRVPAAMSWGNFIAIEHRFGPDDYITTVYGHLGLDRLVEAGHVVSAGQQIGTIGRKNHRINGGYTPHVHFGVREGRNAEIGSALLRVNMAGRSSELTLTALGQDSIELQLPERSVPLAGLQLNGRHFDVDTRAGKLSVPATLLWEIQRPDFALVGYALSTNGWKDPIRFLRAHNADTNPAPFEPKVKRGSHR
jgi:murein DD-endopeptidase MepM/ murein hydrolase activator NlpD